MVTDDPTGATTGLHGAPLAADGGLGAVFTIEPADPPMGSYAISYRAGAVSTSPTVAMISFVRHQYDEAPLVSSIPIGASSGAVRQVLRFGEGSIVGLGRPVAGGDPVVTWVGESPWPGESIIYAERIGPSGGLDPQPILVDHQLGLLFAFFYRQVPAASSSGTGWLVAEPLQYGMHATRISSDGGTPDPAAARCPWLRWGLC
jgi:hypothetical protein